jgi:hypothetical protein
MYLQNFYHPISLVIVFVSHGCGERLIEVFVEEE